MVTDTGIFKYIEPRLAFYNFATTHITSNFELGLLGVVQHLGIHKWANIQAHVIVEVTISTDWLLGFCPAYEYIVGRPAFKDDFQATS